MTIDFRCENCGKLLSVQSDAGSTFKCPHCGKKATVPAGLASLPQPRVASNMPPQAAPGAPAPAGADEMAHHEGEAVIGVMAKVMPWIISVFFHLGLALIFAFATLIAGAAPNKEKEEVIIADAAYSDDPGGSLTESKNQSAESTMTTVDRAEYSKHEAIQDSGQSTKGPISVAGLAGPSGGGSGAGASLGLGLKNGGGGTKAAFLGHGGNAHHVVFVIDRSGSMSTTFDYVRKAMLDSIVKLSEKQDFHVIFFATGAPQENPPKQLVPGIDEYKAQASAFLQGINPEGQTDPLPALTRAFDVLDKADPAKPGKLLYLLTDGLFPDNEAVIKLIDARNKKKDVHVVTFLYDDKSPEAVKVLKKIAEDNGGHFKQISSDE